MISTVSLRNIFPQSKLKQNMNYVYFAIKVAPVVASLATITSTIHSTVTTLHYVSSWIYGSEREEEEEYWQYIDDGGPVRLETR